MEVEGSLSNLEEGETVSGRLSIPEIGNQYGKLTVLSRAGSKGRSATWLCRCGCGAEVVIRGDSLRSNNTRSCGCLQREQRKQYLKNEIGKRYGRLIILGRAGMNRHGQRLWLCRCECGKELKVLGGSLRRGATQSCGCLQKERAGDANRLPIGEAAFNRLIDRIKRSAKQRGYIWSLTEDQVRQLTSRPCYYCGAEPAQVSSGADLNGSYIYNGLDRINNENGYTLKNVVPCCQTCNYGKRTMVQDEFLAWIARVYVYSILEEKDETFS